MQLIFIFLLAAVGGQQLHLNDVCNLLLSPIECYIWAGNPAPFNSPAFVLLSPSLCVNGCVMKLNPYALQTCATLAACAGVEDGTSGDRAIFYLDTVSFSFPNMSMQSLLPAVSVQLAPISELSGCTLVSVVAPHARLMGIDFIYNSTCLIDPMAYPVIFLAGGTVVLSGLTSVTQKVVLFAATTAALNLTLALVVGQGPQAVIMLDVSGELVIDTLTTLFVYGSLQCLPASNVVNVSELVANLVVTPLLVCPPPIVEQDPNCNLGSIMKVMLGLLYAVLTIVFTVGIVFACRGCTHVSKGINQHILNATTEANQETNFK